MKSHISRDTDVVNGVEDLEHLYTFEKFPVFMGCVNHPIQDDLLENMSWHISKSSGLVQLNPLLPLDVVYFTEHGSGTVGKLWNEHHLLFSKFINKFKPKSILEIGGLHGILAINYLNIDESIRWTMIEPNPRVDPSVPIKVIKGFFDDSFSSEEQYDAVVHSHVLEHIYEPKVFFNHLSTFIEEGKLLIFSVPNMQEMINRKYVNCINFEHTFLLTEIYIDYFLKIMGFEILEKEFFKNDHSVFYAARKIQNFDLNSSQKEDLSRQYDLNKKVFDDYINFHLEDVAEINKIISNSNKPIFLFGAHVFAQYLISFGLNTEKVIYIIDNDLQKSDKRLYGTNLISKSPKILSNYESPIVILRAGVYNDEIKTDILNNINSNTIFI
jgi:hypothetical protein